MSLEKDWTRILRSCQNQGGDPREVQERISWEMDNSEKHAHGHKEQRKTCSISRCSAEKKALEIDNELGTSTYEGKLGTSGRVTR